MPISLLILLKSLDISKAILTFFAALGAKYANRKFDFIAVLINGPVEASPDFRVTPIFEGAGLALLVSLLGWMPAGMEASTMNSIWTIEKTNSSGYKPTLSESLFDFKFGYIFTMLLAIMFMTIGAYAVYGTGADLGGNATVFTNKLIGVFTTNLGDWSYYVIAVAAFGTIYGTFITIMDAFSRCFVRAVRILKYDTPENNVQQQTFLKSAYKVTVVVVGLGGFLLFYLSTSSMLQMLQWVTILSFLLSPIIAYINLRAVLHPDFPESHRPSKTMIFLAYLGLSGLLGFAMFYLFDLVL